MKDQIKEAAEKYALYNASVNEEKNAVKHFIAGAEYALSLPKEPEWVSVEERLPEAGRFLCVVEEQTDLGKSRFVWNCSYSDRHGFLDSMKEVVVTHWMPLPSPPKELTP